MRRHQSGFTLIEIAIVLVIIGLLLGGILKGQELINSARVRNLVSQIDGTKAAFFGFQDRYRALPGDFTLATTQIPSATQNGNGDGQITGTESIAVWDHISHAGFLNGTYVYNAAESDATTPRNPFGAFIQIIFDSEYQGTAATPATDRHNMKTGPRIPVDILAEIDRKIDDGLANSGSMRFSNYAAGGAAPVAADCFAAATGRWSAGNGETNCGAAILF